MKGSDGPRPTFDPLRSGLRAQRQQMALLLDVDPKEIGIEINAAQSGLLLSRQIVELIITQLQRGI